MADVKTKQFFGTEQVLMNITSDLAAGNFSAAGTAFDNTSDASVPYATHAVAVIEFDMAVSTGTLYPVIELWATIENTNGTADDTDAPSGTAQNGGKFLGSWTVSTGTSLQRRSTVISLEGIKSFVPYLKNGTAQTIDATSSDSNLVLEVTPFTYGVTT
jgi:hypothetical protein